MGKASRVKRERALRPAAPAGRSSRSLSRLGAAAALAAVFAAGAIGFIESARPAPPPAALGHVAEAARAYAGIPQRGGALGRPDAPVTMVVYVDPQCPYCGEWERVAMPELAARYVRPGLLRIVVRGLHFVGPDSERALRLLDAASLRGRFFQAAALLYWNQGEENTGWVSDGYLRSLAYALPGDPARLLADRNAPAVEAKMRADGRAAVRDAVASTPWIELGHTGSKTRHVEPARLDAEAVARSIEALAGGAVR